MLTPFTPDSWRRRFNVLPLLIFATLSVSCSAPGKYTSASQPSQTASQDATNVKASGKQSSSPFLVTYVPETFERYRFGRLWFRDMESDLSLGITLGDFKGAAFGTRIHDGNGGPVEYSCYPDDFLWTERAGQREYAYAGYMSWKQHAAIEENGELAVSYYERRHGFGLETKYIEPQILKKYSDIKADISVRHSLRRGSGYVKTEVSITNTYNEPSRFVWVYQDGQFVHLVDADQKLLTPMAAGVSERYFLQPRTSRKGHWVALAHTKRSVAAVTFSPDASVLFVGPQYLGVRGITPAHCKDIGFTCPLSGDDRHLLKPRLTEEELNGLALPAITGTVLEDRTKPIPEDHAFKVQGAILDFGELLPGQSKTLKYYRFGAKGSDSLQVERSVNETIRKIDAARFNSARQ